MLWRVMGILASASVLAGLLQPAESLPLSSPRADAPRPTIAATVSPPPVIPSEPSDPEPPATEPKPKPVDCAKLKCVALTFDDGPVSGTADLLRVLKRKHVRATFFVLGQQVTAHPAIIRRMVAEGHVIGNHSWNHPEFWGMSAKAIRRQLARTDHAVASITGHRPTLVRTPFGEINARVRKIARSRGDALILWDVDPLDWKKHSAKVVAKRVITHARRGSIILSHDVWPSTRHAYARIIDGLRAKGFTLVTVPELLGHRLKPGRVYLRA